MKTSGSFDTWEREALVQVSRKGGIASGAARRAKRSAIEREKVENIALREMLLENDRQHRENVRLIREAKRLLADIKQSREYVEIR